jgi:hypothetical protein
MAPLHSLPTGGTSRYASERVGLPQPVTLLSPCVMSLVAGCLAMPGSPAASYWTAGSCTAGSRRCMSRILSASGSVYRATAPCVALAPASLQSSATAPCVALAPASLQSYAGGKAAPGIPLCIEPPCSRRSPKPDRFPEFVMGRSRLGRSLPDRRLICCCKTKSLLRRGSIAGLKGDGRHSSRHSGSLI